MEQDRSGMDESTDRTLQLMTLERRYSAHNYTPLPVVFDRALGSKVWDCDGREYWDFGGSYCATNQGHSHPRIVEAMMTQCQKLALPSRAFTHSLYPAWCEFICRTFDYESVLPLNGGAEIVEAAVKCARSWGYRVKGVPPNKAVVLTFAGCYHGRTMVPTSMSTTPTARLDYGPFVPNVGAHWDAARPDTVLRYNDIEGLELALQAIGEQVCAVLIESIQGEAGVIIPDDGYLRAVKQLCTRYHVLYIADEIQVGLGRAGHMVFCESQGVKADILLLAKSISGGLYPTSVMLASRAVMNCIAPNSHGATFSGSPMSCAVSRAAITVIQEEKLCRKALVQGDVFLRGLLDLQKEFPAITAVRGAGLLIAIDVNPAALSAPTQPWSCWHLSMLLLHKHIIAKLVQTNTLKLTPALNIPEQGILDCLQALRECFTELPLAQTIPGAIAFHNLGGASTLA